MTEVTVSVPPPSNGEGDVRLTTSRKRKGRGDKSQKSKRSKQIRKSGSQKTKKQEGSEAQGKGFTTCSRRSFGTRSLTSSKRTCLLDAFFHGCQSLGLKKRNLYNEIKKKTLWGGDVEENCSTNDISMSVIIECSKSLGLQCTSVKKFLKGSRSLWQRPGGTMLNLLRFTNGIFLISLRITCVDDTHDSHVIEFNANLGHVRDNNPGADIVIIDSTDLQSSTTAYQVFHYFFPISKYIEIQDVHQLKFNE